MALQFIKKHASELSAGGVERPAARLFSNPPGDYGSMVNEVVGTGDWEDESSLGETWKGRNVFSYGRNEGNGVGGQKGTARPEVLDKLLATTERVVQEIDSVEYGLTDIQEYYANTGGEFLPLSSTIFFPFFAQSSSICVLTYQPLFVLILHSAQEGRRESKGRRQ